MGRRARSAGITNRVLRAAQAAAREQDDDAAAVAQRVYHAAVELKGDPTTAEALPMPVLAPLIVAAETVAPGALKLAGRPVTEEMAQEVAAYLVAGFREMAVMFDPKHFEEWRARADGAASDSEPG